MNIVAKITKWNDIIFRLMHIDMTQNEMILFKVKNLFAKKKTERKIIEILIEACAREMKQWILGRDDVLMRLDACVGDNVGRMEVIENEP